MNSEMARTAREQPRGRVYSFIVPAHDEAALIGGTLAALQAAANDLQLDHEIIVVDDASTDATAAIAREAGARVLQVDHRHIAATRNAGASVANGDRLVFVDADTWVDVTVLAAAVTAMDGGAIGGGCAVRLHGNARPVEKLFAALVMRMFRLTRIAPGCFVFCTRTAFDTAGGFDESLYAAEDVALSRTLARQGRFVILRESVSTSDRKLRTFSVAEHLRLVLQVAFRGRGALRSREHLGLWYDKRRDRH